MVGAEIGDHFAGGEIHGGEQVDGAIADIVMGLSFRGGWQHRQDWGSAVQRLDLGFLIHGEASGVEWRRHVEADDVADLFDQ